MKHTSSESWLPPQHRARMMHTQEVGGQADVEAERPARAQPELDPLRYRGRTDRNEVLHVPPRLLVPAARLVLQIVNDVLYTPCAQALGQPPTRIRFRLLNVVVLGNRRNSAQLAGLERRAPAHPAAALFPGAGGGVGRRRSARRAAAEFRYE